MNTKNIRQGVSFTIERTHKNEYFVQETVSMGTSHLIVLCVTSSLLPEK